MRRKVGVASIQKRDSSNAAFSTMGKALEAQKLSSVMTTLNAFKDSLVQFAQKHREKINSDPEFRMQFHQMCMGLGVDPLASSKGFWSDVLGVGDFYFELGVVIIQICVKTRSANGGLLKMTELLDLLHAHNQIQKQQKVEALDVSRAIAKLAVLGGGFRVLSITGEMYVVSTPLEISTDHEVLIVCAKTHGYVSPALLAGQQGWSNQRFTIVITPLLYESIVWVDEQAGTGEKCYEFPMLTLTKEDMDPPPPYEQNGGP